MFDSFSSEEIKKETQLQPQKIKVIAVGGGGGNALNYIREKGLTGVEYIAMNTDITDLERSMADKKLLLGPNLTRGHGAGSDARVGRNAAKESENDIKEYIKDAHMIYITAGMGGGTGTGAAPFIAKCAKEIKHNSGREILVVAVVTRPFLFEGKSKVRVAEEGIHQLAKCVDAMIVISNQRLFNMSKGNIAFADAFAIPNEVLREAVQGITELITSTGQLNVDFADVNTAMKNSGYAVMGVGNGEGENKIIQAIDDALKSPLMDMPTGLPKAMLLNITGGKDITLKEIQEMQMHLNAIISPDVKLFLGLVQSTEKTGKVKVTVIATGYDLGRVLETYTEENLNELRKKQSESTTYKPLYRESKQYIRQNEQTPDYITQKTQKTAYVPPTQQIRHTDMVQNIPNQTTTIRQPNTHREPEWLTQGKGLGEIQPMVNFDQPTFVREGKSLQGAKPEDSIPE